MISEETFNKYKETNMIELEKWECFKNKISLLNDLFLTSIFSHLKSISIDKLNKIVTVELSNNSCFCKDKIQETTSSWRPEFDKTFGVDWKLVIL